MLLRTRAVRLLVSLLGLGLAGCVENLPDLALGQGDVRTAIAKGSMASPRPSTVAMMRLDGGPTAVTARFGQVFAKEAADRQIAVVDSKDAHYLVRGYLSAYPSDHGTDVAYVYDVFDADRHRIERVNDVLTVPGSGTDTWALLDDKAMASLAGHSADDLAVVLAGMPEAKAGHQTLAAIGSTPPK